MQFYYKFNDESLTVPNSELRGRLHGYQYTSTEEVSEYYQALKVYVKQGGTGCQPDLKRAIDDLHLVEVMLHSEGVDISQDQVESAFKESTPSKATATSDRLNQTYNKEKTLKELEAEILEAATSKNFKLALTKVAAANNLYFDAVEAIAKSLLQDKGLNIQYDLEKTEYQRCINEIRDLELQVGDPGEKQWKMQELAKKYKRSRRDLIETYCKSLIAQQLPDPVNLKTLQDKYGDRRQWVLRGWIPKAALVLLHAHGGTGKTLFVQYLIKLLVYGQDWQEYKMQGRGKVLYIQTDTSPANLIESVKQVGIDNDCPIEYHINWQVDYTAQLYKWIEKSRPSLVVIDSLSSVNRFTTISENDTEYARPILYLGDIAREFGCSFLLIHHSNSDGNSRGSKAIRAAVDEEWKLEITNPKDPSDPERLLTMQKSRSRMPMKYKLKFDDDSFAWDLLEPEDEEGNLTQNGGTRYLIVDYLTKHSGQMFAAIDFAEKLGISEATIRKELPGLYREGLIDREPNPNFRKIAGGGQPKHFYTIYL